MVYHYAWLRLLGAYYYLGTGLRNSAKTYRIRVGIGTQTAKVAKSEARHAS